MPSWHLNLLSHSGKQLDCLTQYINSNSHATIFIDGDTANDDTWRFVDYSDETQARRDWISQFSVFQFSSKIVDTYVLTPPPVQGLVSRVHLPPTAGGQQFWVLLRHGDTVEFEVTRARVEVVFDPDSADPHVQVESSGPGAFSHKIKHEIKDEPDNDDETDDQATQPTMDVRRGTSAEESQHLYSTSREHLSPTPRPTRESQVVKDTPNRRRIRSQHESTIPESLPMEDTNPEQSQPTDNDNDNDNGIVSALPDVNTGELPDTSPTEALRFRVPTQHTPSPSHQSFSTSEVGKLISNLNEDNPPSQVPQSTFSPKKTPRTDVIAGQSSNDPSTTDSVEPTISPEPIELTGQKAESPAIEPVATTLEDVASPVDIINDGIINDRDGTTVLNDGDAADMEPNPSVASTSKKRKKVLDSDSVASSTKRAKLIEGDAGITGTTPLSTASKRSSGLLHEGRA
ncbi:unnamed protein product [Aureobasidium mustum]|uniref:Uncharacterized protein n=1 Tax=Aureobasidium mustum TaxID=2773714 RepID=A0A9N8JK54_9PEZI|nr:unnamed protein product [Aureobasidium mustum]